MLSSSSLIRPMTYPGRWQQQTMARCCRQLRSLRKQALIPEALRPTRKSRWLQGPGVGADVGLCQMEVGKESKALPFISVWGSIIRPGTGRRRSSPPTSSRTASPSLWVGAWMATRQVWALLPAWLLSERPWASLMPQFPLGKMA